MLRAGLAVPAESVPGAVPATPSESRREVYGVAPTRSSVRAPAAGTLRGRIEHERLYGDQVVEHRLARGAAVAPRDRLDDSPMVLMGARRPARRVDRFLTALGEEVHDRVHDAGDRAIVRGGADRGVKRGVLREPRAPGRDLPRLVLEDPLHLLDLVRRRAA